MFSARKSRLFINRMMLPTILSSAVSALTLTTIRYNHVEPSHTAVINRRFNSISRQREENGFKRNYFSASRLSFLRQSTNGNELTALTHHLSTSDIHHMKLATQLARIGSGNTYPNPAVGCVLVRHNDESSTLDAIIGSGFHPKAGMPHAEVFALLEACGHVDDGVNAARSVTSLTMKTTPLTNKVLDLLDVYKGQDGALELFSGCLSNFNVTAYVTLEPCCHVGQTPPCALSLVAAGIKRVVVGFRDPNPRVDGGGIQMLKNSGIDVYVMNQSAGASIEEKEAAVECADLVEYFVKRISPQNGFSPSMYDNMTGKKRVLLRGLALRQKTSGSMPSVEWLQENDMSENDKTDIGFLHEVNIDSRFLEAVDRSLFDHELVLLRLNNIVNKKKGAKILGERVAEIMWAHLVQVLGHTALLYRPAMPPVLDLDDLVRKESDIPTDS